MVATRQGVKMCPDRVLLDCWLVGGVQGRGDLPTPICKLPFIFELGEGANQLLVSNTNFRKGRPLDSSWRSICIASGAIRVWIA